MMIFIPMTGTGERYKRAGYTQPKPLVPVDGAPMIERVLAAFPPDGKYVFGVNREHAETTELLPTLRRLRPQGTIVVMDGHKDGPVRTILEAADALPDDEDVCVNYCDFGVGWSFSRFVEWLRDGAWEGAMTGYRGFHPHSLGPTLYAYIRNAGERVIEIREKHHFTPNKFEEYASSGLYWFKTGRALKAAARALVDRGERVNNEFYASMLMQVLIEDDQRVGIYELDRFYQWGTPEDLRDYESWARAMRRLPSFLTQVAGTKSAAAQVFPMAGLGQRFVDQGYADPKPLIEVAGRTMIEQSIRSLPEAAPRVLVARSEHVRDGRFRDACSRLDAQVVELPSLTEGQAITAKLGVTTLDPARPVLIAPCDTGYVYDPEAWLEVEGAGDADLIVWTARNHLPAVWRPHMYGWLHAAGGWAKAAAVKTMIPLVPPAEQEVICGTFWFRSGALFLEQVQALADDDDRVNGEFYIDTIARRSIAEGKKVRAFTVDKYIPWGTPEELQTFHYWNDVHREGAPLV